MINNAYRSVKYHKRVKTRMNRNLCKHIQLLLMTTIEQFMTDELLWKKGRDGEIYCSYWLNPDVCMRSPTCLILSSRLANMVALVSSCRNTISTVCQHENKQIIITTTTTTTTINNNDDDNDNDNNNNDNDNDNNNNEVIRCMHQ